MNGAARHGAIVFERVNAGGAAEVMKSITKLVLVVGLMTVSTGAFAQAKPPAAGNDNPGAGEGLPDDYCSRKGVLCVGVLKIVGRVQRPFALAEVGRISPKLTLSELRQPFLDRIEEAVVHDPF